MRLRVKHAAFMMLLLILLVSGCLWAANGANSVKVEGNRLSVYSAGMPLGKLLTAVESKTGIHFRFNELMREKKIFVDFEGLLLTEGIKKIISPLSFAVIYDDTGKLHKVIILEQWKNSGTEVRWEEESDSPEGGEPGPSDSISYTPRGGFDNHRASKGPSLGKGGVYSDDLPVDKAHSEGKPPNTQDEIPKSLPIPSVAGSVHLPIPDFEDTVMEVPPVDKAPSEGKPPNLQGDILEDLPVPGAVAADNLPLPGS